MKRVKRRYLSDTPADGAGTVEVGGTPPCQENRETWSMDAENVVGLIIALALLGYLIAALIKPERF